MILNFKIQKQILDNWCWAALSSSISFYFNDNSKWSQSIIASALLGHDSCSTVNINNASIAPPVCDQVVDISSALKHTGNYATEISRPLTFNEGQIDGGWPICCQILWKEFSVSHFVAIYGYQGANLIIGDPQSGVCTVDYNQFVNSYRGGVWRRSIGVQANNSDNLI
jgi:hypothetical protein